MKTNTSSGIFAVSKLMAQAFLLVLVVAVPVASSHAAPVADKHKSVLLLFSEESNLPTQAIVEQSLRSTLRNSSPVPLEVYSEYLGFLRTPLNDYEKELVGLLRRKYEGRKFDLIIAVSPPALRLLLKNQPEIFPDTPVVFQVLDQRNVADLNLGPNVTGIWGAINFKSNLDLALAMQPNTRKVVVIAGAGEYDKNWTAEVRKDYLDYESRLEITYLIGLTIEEQKQALSSLPQHTIVFFVSATRDNAGNSYYNPDVVRQISSASSAPIYGTTDGQLGMGIIGGSLVSFEAFGVQTAELGLRILSGEKPQAIAPHGVPNVVMFDQRELRRWGIDEAKLPPGSIVRYKEVSVWELYKWRIVGAIALIVLQALGIAWLLFTQAKRRQAEKRSSRFALLAEAEHQHLDEIVANVPGIVWEARLEGDDPIPKTTFISPYLGKMLGYTAGEWLSTPDFRLSVIVDEDREKVLKISAQVLESGEDGITQYRYRTKDGRVLWVESHLTAIRDENGEAVGLRGVTMNIAEGKRAEVELRKAVEEVNKLKNQLEEENIYLREEIKLAHDFDEIVGRSDATKYVLFKIEQVAPTVTTVLITGETGTGKELVAHAIHSSGSRRDGPMVKVNCAALSPTLIESELFGHEKGSFTGATGRKIGRFELANGATIFLDEIGELPMELQAKLLRVIQEGEFERLGSSKTIKVDTRIIAASNRNLKIAVEQGTFREDLWYRLNVFPITVPPLRDRKEDIPLLVEHFVKRFSQKVGRRISSIPPASMRILQDYSWPGNVRELANVLERAVINTTGTVLRVVDHFEKAQVELSQSDKTLEELEKEYILRILEKTAWRIEGHKGAARILGLNPSTLRTRMAKLGIQKLETRILTSTAS